MYDIEGAIMKCPSFEGARGNKMEKSSTGPAVVTAGTKMSHPKTTPMKGHNPVKPQFSPGDVTAELYSLNTTTRAIHNKENSNNRENDRALYEGFEDSGYLSLHNSQIDDHHGEEDDSHVHRQPPASPCSLAAHQEKTITPRQSPYKCHGKTSPTCLGSLVTASTPTICPGNKVSTHSLSSTPANLPILKYQQAVCEELAKSFERNKRYDWSVVDKLAEEHLLDRVIGRHMGQEYIDVFSSLLSRNMRNILTSILALLGDMDLISCRKVSRTWRKIICEDNAALSRCQRAEQALRESRSSLGQTGCGLTRDVAVSRVVLSCMQTLASSTPSSSSSSTPSCRTSRRVSLCQKDHTHNSQHTRFEKYLEAASNLKQHESLRPCRRCSSPATYSAEAQRATCTHPSCLFDFCTRCQEPFHSSSPCRVVRPRSNLHSSKSTPILPGSARSKRNLRRL
ncbi:F-box only protein 5 [Myripristis murdjan]|uniref:F-box protein 5 n=1 Tax=Myripristis murdjan TaxID=586833 RepID=A0A668AA85_9TELE|nr:F-box only protein 5 [Myripristis murdjan]